MIRKPLLIASTLLFVALLPWQANADVVSFEFAGPGVSGTVDLTYGSATDGKYSQAFEVTGISGTFSDSNNGLNIVNAPIGPLVPINPAAPDPTNLLAPDDFSRFAVASGLPAVSNGFLTYDNLYYPNGSPQTASDYPAQGGILDIYGLLFDIGGGDVVNLWSNGTFAPNGAGPIDYGVAVATADTALDYVSGGVSVSPEPTSFLLLGSALLGLLFWRRHSRQESL
jgi:hypothetical protein